MARIEDMKSEVTICAEKGRYMRVYGVEMALKRVPNSNLFKKCKGGLVSASLKKEPEGKGKDVVSFIERVYTLRMMKVGKREGRERTNSEF
jgi:hypothetical protein